MNAVIDFLREYWFQLSTGLFALIEVILIVVKRKPKSIDDFKFVLSEVESLVPELVISRERPGEGVLKKTEVLVSAKKLIEKRLGRALSEHECFLVAEVIDHKIETVLSTPTKKEKLNEK